MKLFYLNLTIFIALLVLVLQFSFCAPPTRPDFPPRLKNDNNLRIEGKPELGEKIVMYVDAEGAHPLTYKWYKNDVLIEGAESDSLVIDSLNIEDDGVYTCEVYVKSVSALSNPYKLLIKKEDQQVLLDDNGIILSSGKPQLNTPFFLYIKPVSNLPLTYQWYKDSSIIEQANNDTLLFGAVSTKDQGNYYCEVKHNIRTERSLYYLLMVRQGNQSPVFKDSLPHDSYQINEGGTITIQFEAIDENTDEILYTLTENTLPRPETALFDTILKTLSWTSKQGDKGVYKIQIEASDGKTATKKEVHVGIGKVNLPPGISIAGMNQDDTVYISENDTLQFIAEIKDPNAEDKPAFIEPENMPKGAAFDTSSGAFNYTPEYDVSSESGNNTFQTITLYATDNAVDSPLQSKYVFHITVIDKKFLITAKSGTGGAIDPSGTIKTEPGKDYTFTITPKVDWKIKQVLVNDKDEGVISSYTFKKIQKDNTINAQFEEIMYTLSIASDDNGNAESEGNIQVKPDTSIMISVKANTGYRFEKWEISQGSPEIKQLSIDTFEVLIKNENSAIKALFVKKISVKNIACGDNYSLFLKSDNTLWSTGENHQGQLGDGTENYHQKTPVQVLTDVDSVICGAFHTFAIRNDKTLWAAGGNSYGQLGMGDQVHRRSFTQVPGMKNIKGISAGHGHTLLIKDDGTLWGAGWNNNAVLALDDYSQNRLTFTKIPDMTDIIKVSAGTEHSVVIRSDHTIWSAGHNRHGELGLGDTDMRHSFTKIPGMNNVADATIGSYSTYILKNDNSLWATGQNNRGQLGDGTFIDKYSPVHVMDDVIAVSSKGIHTLFLKTDHTLWAVGNYRRGQFGNGSTDSTATPVKIQNNIKSATAGDEHTIIIKSDSTVWGAGNNYLGKLGLGDNSDRTIFTEIPLH